MEGREACSRPDLDGEDAFKVLVTSDNHLGYMERDPIRGDDSFRIFEEILGIASDKKAGDLFHDNRPSRNCLYKTICILRKFCLGKEKCAVKIISNQNQAFKMQLGVSNCGDPNLSISIPIFAIHGNHDDPSGADRLSTLDVIGASGLLNYFGRQDCVDEVKLYPVLFSKGKELLALYGLGNIRDERLNRTFRQRGVKMFRPSENLDEWFNIFVLHQNRYQHGSQSNYIPENFLASFLDLVVWGHEHDCEIDPLHNSSKEFDVIQPGSPLVTSFTRKEMCEKFVCILKIKNRKYAFEKIRLHTPRPFVFDEMVLDLNMGAPDRGGDVDILRKKVDSMISQLNEGRSRGSPENRSDSDTMLPLVRLKVFGRLLEGKVANPRDALLYIRRLGAQEDLGALGPHDRPEGEQGAAVSIEALVNEHLSNNKLDLLPQLELGDAVRAFVDKDDNNSIKEYAGMPDSATLLSSLLRFIQRYLSVLRDSFSDTRILSDADIATLELKIRALAGKISREASKSARHGAEPLGLSASLSGGSPRKNASGESPAANVTGAYSRDSDNGRLGGEARVLGSSHVGRHPGPGNRWAPPSALRFSDRPPVDTGEDEVTFSTFRSSMANLGEQ